MVLIKAKGIIQQFTHAVSAAKATLAELRWYATRVTVARRIKE